MPIYVSQLERPPEEDEGALPVARKARRAVEIILLVLALLFTVWLDIRRVDPVKGGSRAAETPPEAR